MIPGDIDRVAIILERVLFAQTECFEVRIRVRRKDEKDEVVATARGTKELIGQRGFESAFDQVLARARRELLDFVKAPRT